MSISLATHQFSVHNGQIVEYDVLKNKKVVGMLCYCSSLKRWKYSASTDNSDSVTLVNIAEAWSLLVNRLGLEKAQ